MENQNAGGSGRKPLIIAVSLLTVGFIAATIFGTKAFMERQETRRDLNKLVASEIEKAKAAQKTELEAKFAAESKEPNKTYKGPATYGAVTFSYPKTWSAYIDETNSSTPINGYFHPNFVPALQGETDLALRVELLSSAYASALSQFDSQVKTGKLKASAYIPPKMAGIAGVQPGTKLEGALTSAQNGSVVILKIRDKTLKISTQSPDYNSDFNNIVLTSLTFTP